MYRIFCESYRNFIESFDEHCSRLELSKPLELIADENKYKEEKNKETEIYKKTNDLIYFMKENIERFPRLKAFIWTIGARNMKGKKYNIANKEELEEQTKLVNSFLKLVYWY